MKNTITRTLFALTVAAAAIPLLAQAEAPAVSAQNPEAIIKKWPKDSRAIARAMIEKYGQPKRFRENALIWYDNGTWKKTVVHRGAWPHFLGSRDKDYLEQTIAYPVTEDKVPLLARFDKRIEAETITGELSMRSESENTNYLVLNLAEEIITERRSVEKAQDFYRKTQELSEAGKTSRYLEGFLFPIHNDGVAAPNVAGPEFH